MLPAAARACGTAGALFVTHSIANILRARMLLIACGYEDADELDHLRTDPGFKLASGRLPDTGRDLCSQPTMSRWESAPSLREVSCLSYAMVDTYCASYKRPPPRLRWTSMTPRRFGTFTCRKRNARRSMSCMAISRCRCSLRIMMSAVSCRSMSMTRRQPDQSRCCGALAHPRRVLKSAIICVAWYGASVSTGRILG
jgi:hypothetical protein